MILRLLILTFVAASLGSTAASAEETGFFTGVDLSGGAAFGSSRQTNGGAPWAGGTILDKIKFGGAIGVGGHAGYRFSSTASGFISYQYMRGDVSWTATFPAHDVASGFKGDATSNVVMANLAYDFALSDTTSIRVSAGAGLSFNSLSSIVESDVGTGLFLADLADNTRISPAAQIGAGIQHRIMQNAVLGLNASVIYTGSFETGDTRSGNLGITPIIPYKIGNVWRTNLTASARYEF